MGDDIARQNQNLGYFHNAIFKKSSDLQVMASCVTFASQDGVPPGSLYNVRKVINYNVRFSIKDTMQIGIYMNTSGSDHIRTYIYNENQVLLHDI